MWIEKKDILYALIMEPAMNKNFRLVLYGQIISMFGSAIQRFALSLYILEITGNSSIYANILALSVLPYIFVAPIAGNIADRFNHRKTMIVLDILSATSILIYGIGIYINFYPIITTSITMILLSLFSACYNPVVTSCIPNIVEEESLSRSNSFIAMVSSISNIAGPAVSGIMFSLIGINGIIIINFISFIFSAFMEYFITYNFKSYEKLSSNINIIDSFKESLDTIKNIKKHHPVVMGIIISYGLFNICIVPIITIILPSEIKLALRLSSSSFGIIEGIVASGMLFGSIFIALCPYLFRFDKYYRWNYIIPVSIVGMSSAYIFSDNKFLLAAAITVACFFIMFSLSIGNTVTLTQIQKSVPSNILGKVSSISTAFASSTVPIGQIITGFILQYNIHRGLLLVIYASISLIICIYIRNFCTCE